MPPVFRQLAVLVISTNIAAVGGRLALLLTAKHLGGSPIMLGLLIGLYSLPGAITGVWIGRWFDRYDARRLLSAGALMIAAAAAVVFVFFSLGAMFAAAVFYGIGINLVQIGAQHLTGLYSTDTNRTSNYNLIAFALSLSLLFGPMIAGFSLDHVGYRAAFLLLAAIPLAGVVGLALRALPARGLRAPRASGQSEVHVVALLRDPRLRRLFTLELLFASGWDSLSFLVPLYGSQLGLSASVIGAIASTSSLATLLVRLAVPWLARRLGNWRVLALALSLTAIGYLGIPFFDSALALAALVFVVGAGLGMGNPISMTLLYEFSPGGRVGELIGLRMATMKTCNTVLPLLAGNLGAAIGVAPVFWLFGLLILGGARAAAAAHARSRRQPGT